jgi:hypothetical protein
MTEQRVAKAEAAKKTARGRTKLTEQRRQRETERAVALEGAREKVQRNQEAEERANLMRAHSAKVGPPAVPRAEGGLAGRVLLWYFRPHDHFNYGEHSDNDGHDDGRPRTSTFTESGSVSICQCDSDAWGPGSPRIGGGAWRQHVAERSVARRADVPVTPFNVLSSSST